MQYITAITGASAENSRASVRGLTAVGIVVEEIVPGEGLDPAEQKTNELYTSEMKAFLENKLSEHHITILSDTQLQAEPTPPFVYVAAYIRKMTHFVSPDDGEPGYIAFVLLELLQTVTINRKPALQLPAPTWSVQAGMGGKKAQMPAILTELMTRLLDAFFDAVESSPT